MDAILLQSLHGSSLSIHTRPASESASRAFQSHEGSALRERAWYLISRAYQNLYGQAMPADEDYRHTLCHAAYQLMLDPRAEQMNDKALLQAFEDIIRISDEHTREARKHLSRASNPVYLREMALDNALEQQKYLHAISELMPQNEVRVARAEHTGRLHRQGALIASEVTALTCRQLVEVIEQEPA